MLYVLQKNVLGKHIFRWSGSATPSGHPAALPDPRQYRGGGAALAPAGTGRRAPPGGRGGAATRPRQTSRSVILQPIVDPLLALGDRLGFSLFLCLRTCGLLLASLRRNRQPRADIF